MAKKMDAAGLFGVQLDGLASVYGSAGVDNIPTLLMGAHTDTRRRSSALDGAVGIAFALEASRVLHLGGAADWTAWSIVDWQLADSIHPAGTGLTGPRAFVSEDGVFTPSDQLWRARGAAGVAGTPIMHASGRHGGWNAYLEARVERGTHLRSVNATLGVVRSIAGVRRVRIVCGETAASKVSDGSPAYVWRRAGTLEAMRLEVERSREERGREERGREERGREGPRGAERGRAWWTDRLCGQRPPLTSREIARDDSRLPEMRWTRRSLTR